MFGDNVNITAPVMGFRCRPDERARVFCGPARRLKALEERP